MVGEQADERRRRHREEADLLGGHAGRASSCPDQPSSGKKAVGGGWSIDTIDVNVRVMSSGPTSDGNGWQGGIYNPGPNTRTATGTVICMTVATSEAARESAPDTDALELTVTKVD